MLQRYLKFILSDRCINFQLQVKSLIYFEHPPRKYRTTSQSIKSCRYIIELLCDVWYRDIITGNNDINM